MIASPDALIERFELEKLAAQKRARQGLLAFTRYTKPDYQINWHHKIVARHLNLVADGLLRRLIICMPPRTGKSELVSTRFPAFMFGRDPQAQIIAASYNTTLASKMNRGVQRVMDSEEYAKLFPDVKIGGTKPGLGDGQGRFLRRSDEFEIRKHGGFYRSSGTGGSQTGYGMTLGLIDDPTKNRLEANSPTYQERIWDWYTSTFYSRLEKNGAIIICLTRWSSGDLVGRLLDQAKKDPSSEQWTVLSFPALCEAGKHPDDPREVDEPLWPQKYSKERMLQMRQAIGTRDWAALYQQRPAPLEGGIVQTKWWQYWAALPDNLDFWAISCDLTFGDADKEDFCVMQVWARKKASFYLVDQIRAKMGFTVQLAQFSALSAKYPQCRAKYVEKKANGAALISTLKGKIPGIVAVEPRGSKLARAEAISPLVEAGNVYLPDPVKTPWMADYLDEWAYFPNGKNDDQIDATSQALQQLSGRQKMDYKSLAPISLEKKTSFF